MGTVALGCGGILPDRLFLSLWNDLAPPPELQPGPNETHLIRGSATHAHTRTHKHLVTLEDY